MHGCGNDFVLLRAADLRSGPSQAGESWRIAPDALARRVCDRHFGLGADGLLVYEPLPAVDGTARLRMFYWNADGSRAEMCGNGARCVVRLAHERGETKTQLVLETDVGPRPARVHLVSHVVSAVEIDMGPPSWDPATIPVRAREPVIHSPVTLWGADLNITAVSMGNPHAVVFLPDRDALRSLDLVPIGRALSENPLFQRGANASFVAAQGGELHVRTYERGVGPTLACGTAACAAFAVARRTERLRADMARVHVPGGDVEVRQTDDGHLWLRGPAVHVAEGTLAAGVAGTD
jgi:diaminopimelate epimerase